MTPRKGKPLLDYFVKRYTEVEGERPVINSNKKVWAFADMYADLGEKSFEVIDFFFESYENGYHDVDKLMYIYDELLRDMEVQKEEKARRLRIAKETAERVKKFGK